MTQPEKSGSRQARPVRAVMAGLLLLVVLAAALFLIRRGSVRPPAPSEAPADEALSPVEAAKRETQAWVTERMKDPEYREQLQTIVENRRVLAAEANALEDEIATWQRNLATENKAFGDLIAQLADLRPLAETNETATVAVAEVTQEIRSLMEQDPRGGELLAKQNDLNARREALQQEAARMVGLRMQRQQAEKFGLTAPKPTQTGGAE